MPNVIEMLDMTHPNLRTDIAFSITRSFYAFCSIVAIEDTEGLEEDVKKYTFLGAGHHVVR
jgi:hypothetical protein